MKLTRRRFSLAVAALFTCGLAVSPASAQAKKKVLYITKSSGFQHSAVQRKGDQLSISEKVIKEFGDKNGFEVTCSKDASLLNKPETYQQYDLLMFYTSGNLTREGTDKQPAMTEEGKALLLKAIENGKGVVGIHAACDTFDSPGRMKAPFVRPAEASPTVSPFVAMMGGDFAGHGAQQNSAIKVVSKFPGLEDLKDFEMTEEWYAFTNMAPDMHVILVQDTKSMKGGKGDGKVEKMYQRNPYPATWARMQGKGRVFYTSLGHRDDVVSGEIFQKVVLAGMNWAVGNTQFDPKPNMEQVAPQK